MCGVVSFREDIKRNRTFTFSDNLRVGQNFFFDDDNDGCSDNYDDNGGKIDDNDECYPHTLLVSSGKISKFMPRQVGFISS